MAGSSEDKRRRDRDEEPEEEVVPGCDSSDMDTEDYYNQDNYLSNDDTDEVTSDSRARSVVPVPANNSSSNCNASPSSSSSSAAAAAAANSNGNASSSPVAAASLVLLGCPICGKEFRSSKAVCGHMKVHQQQQQHGTIGRHEPQQGTGKKDNKGIIRRNNVAAVAGGWGGTGKRGGAGCCSKQPASPPNAQSWDDQSMAIVVAEAAEPKIVMQPMPLAFAAPNPLPVVLPMPSATPNHSSVTLASTMTNFSDESGSAKPTMHSDAMETVVAAANPPADAVVHLHAADEPHVHATSSVHDQHPIEPPKPTKPADAEERESLFYPAEEQIVQHPAVPIAPPPPLAAASSSAAGRQNPNGYTCKQCGERFPTHQGLGGHMAAHKTRELAAAPCRADDAAKPVKEHVCRECGAVFLAGVQLGGHMRKHYSGVPIVPKKKQRLVNQLPPPAPMPAVPVRVLLFGVDIGAPVQPPVAPQGESSSATEAPSSSNAGVPGEQ